MLPQAWSHSSSTSAEYSNPSSALSYPYPNPKGSELYKLPANPRGSRWIASTRAYTMISANSARQPSLSGRHSEGSWQPCVKVSKCAKTPKAAKKIVVENIPKKNAQTIWRCLSGKICHPLFGQISFMQRSRVSLTELTTVAPERLRTYSTLSGKYHKTCQITFYLRPLFE